MKYKNTTLNEIMYSLSGMRTSLGKGIVGLLSFWSTMITVSVAEPANRGLPLSVAVTTNLWGFI